MSRVYVLPHKSQNLGVSPKTRLSEGDQSAMKVENQDGPYAEGNLKIHHVIECPNDVMSCQFSHDGSLLAVGLINGTIKLYNATSGENLHSLSDIDTVGHGLPVTQIKFYPSHSVEHDDFSNTIIASYASGFLKYWHYPTSTCVATVLEDGQILTMNLSPDGTKVVTGGSEAVLYVYDVMTRALVMKCESSDNHTVMDGHVFRVFAVQYHSMSVPNVFLSGGWDNTVQYWDDRCKQSFRKLYGPHICGDALDIDTTHNHVLTGSWRKHSVLQIWDFVSCNLIKDIPQDPLSESQLYCAKWLGKDSIVCGGSDENMARIVDRATLNTVGELKDLTKGAYAIDMDGDQPLPHIAVASSNKVYILKELKKIETV